MNKFLHHIAGKFPVHGNPEKILPLEDGFINETYQVFLHNQKDPAYILQKKNKNVFRDVPSMMENIRKVSLHLKRKVADRGGDTKREAITMLPALSGEYYYVDESGEFWTLCEYTTNSITYQQVVSRDLAFAGGSAIGLFQADLADFHAPLTNILPGFHNMPFRFRQWDEALAKDAAGRKSALKREISWIENRRAIMLDFYRNIETGTIPARVAHNDTKISNVLFCKEGPVLCMIDLDTVMNTSALYDFGDAVRTYTNTGEEDDINLNAVEINLEFYEALNRGYLSKSVTFLTQAELEHLAFSGLYITFEQVLRFLMDFINGDVYYKIKNPLHNLRRSHAQYKLLNSMELNFSKMQEITNKIAGQKNTTLTNA
jgi:hypothetical protein